MRKFQIIREFNVTPNQIREWLIQYPLPTPTSGNNAFWENYHPQYKTHYNTLMEFLRLEKQSSSLRVILNDNNGLGLLGEIVGDLILRQEFEFDNPPFRQDTPRLGVLAGTVDVETAFPKKGSILARLGKEFVFDYKTHRITCTKHGKYRSPEVSLPQRRFLNSILSTTKKVMILSLAFCECGQIFCKYLELTQKLNLYVKTQELRRKFFHGTLNRDIIEIWVRKRANKMGLQGLGTKVVIDYLEKLVKNYLEELKPLSDVPFLDRIDAYNQKYEEWYEQKVNSSTSEVLNNHNTNVVALIDHFMKSIAP